MRTRLVNLLLIILVLLCFGAGFLFYSELPDKFASHWNIDGKVDGYMDKFLGIFLLPIIMLILLIFFIIIPKIDPLKQNIVAFRYNYNAFVFVIIIFLIFIYALILSWNLGYRFNFSAIITTAIGALFIFLGWILPNFKRNWFIGIRTPWTLSSEEVWLKTHQHGKFVFIFSGLLITFCGLIFPKAILGAIIFLLLGSLWLFVYSYLEYHRKNRSPSSNN